MKYFQFLFIIVLLWQLTCPNLLAQTTINLTLFSSNFSNPLALVNCGDNRVFVVEQRGKIYICDLLGNRNPIPFLDISDRVSQTGSELGLLGMAFDPDYVNNGYFYVFYTAAANNNNTHISRFLRSGINSDLALPSSEQLLISIAKPTTLHNGGTLVFGPDGYLYIGIGDGGNNGLYAQDLSSYLGKILRIDVSNTSPPYSIPPDNPFINISGALPEIWASGLRNAWKFDFDPLNGDLWIADVGQNEREEINLQKAGSRGGQNYGWRCYEGSLTYNTSVNCNTTNIVGYTFPAFEYDHTNDMGCSVTGGNIYRGAQFHDFYGKYIYGDFCTGRMGLLTVNDNNNYANEWITLATYHQISSFGQDRYGEFYLTDYLTGEIFKLSAGNCSPAAVILPSPAPNLCTSDVDTLHAAAADLATNISYQWSYNALDIPGATEPTLIVNQTGQYRLRVLKTDISGCGKVSQITTITATPPNPVITSSPNTCIGNGTVYSITPTADHQYQWSITAGSGTIVAGQGTASITVVWNNGTTGTVTVMEINP